MQLCSCMHTARGVGPLVWGVPSSLNCTGPLVPAGWAETSYSTLLLPLVLMLSGSCTSLQLLLVAKHDRQHSRLCKAHLQPCAGTASGWPVSWLR